MKNTMVSNHKGVKTSCSDLELRKHEDLVSCAAGQHVSGPVRPDAALLQQIAQQRELGRVVQAVQWPCRNKQTNPP